jgi:hypothetical protein
MKFLSIAIAFVNLFIIASAFAAESTSIPFASQVARYEREQPVFQSKQISRERGDVLLALLDGGQATEKWIIKDGKIVSPVPAHLRISITLIGGTIYRMGLSHNGRLLYLPDGLYLVTDVASKQVAEWMGEMEADLRREVVSAPRPCVYKIGTVNDGYTLSGVARLFYGDASKWPQIYEANRAVLKSPHQITGSETLTIPKL